MCSPRSTKDICTLGLNTKEIGRITQAKVLAKLVESGENILLPFSDVGRYDLAIDREGQLVRVECKTGRLKEGTVVFRTCSTKWYGGHEKRHYKGDADFFGVWCPENDTVYLVPVNEAGKTECRLRIQPPKPGGNNTKVRWAEKYEA